MIVDQAEKLRLMVRQKTRRARILAVTSGKGGVGKSNVAANLGICLQASGKNVMLLDADLGLANLDVLLNVRSRYTLAHVISGRRSIEDVVQPAPGGVQLVCGGSGLKELTELGDFQRKRILQEITTLENQADMIIVDTGAGISSNVLSFCEASDHTLVVATPEPASITDAYAMIKCLSRAHTGIKISLLVNMAQNRNQAKMVYQRLAETVSRFLSVVVYDAGYILYDNRLASAVSRCEPVVLAYPRSQASYCFLALAGKLSRASEPLGEDKGFFHKVVNWFF